MSLLKQLFRSRSPAGQPEAPESAQFHDSEEASTGSGSRNAPRRELVHMVLRDTMRKHGIPSDWMDCRVLSMVNHANVSGMHVQFILRGGDDRLMDYIHAFQDSFWIELDKYDRFARQWLLSLSWQFDTPASHEIESIPGQWGDEHDTQPPEMDTQPPDDEDVASDLKALAAIRDADNKTR
jgi:hypothetical protein